MNILIAADGSPYTRRMLAYLAAHDEWLGGAHRYTVMTVVMALPARAAAALDRDIIRSYHDAEADKVFKPIRSFFARQHIEATFIAKVGPAAQQIARYATEGKFDLLLMGSHGHGNLANLVLGSVATQVLARCKTPLLLVR